jgi:transposase
VLEIPASAFAIWFSARNGGVTVAGIDDIIKENGHVALHLPLNNTDLNPIELVCGDIKNRISTRMRVCEFEGNADILQKSIC